MAAAAFKTTIGQETWGGGRKDQTTKARFLAIVADIGKPEDTIWRGLDEMDCRNVEIGLMRTASKVHNGRGALDACRLIPSHPCRPVTTKGRGLSFQFGNA